MLTLKTKQQKIKIKGKKGEKCWWGWDYRQAAIPGNKTTQKEDEEQKDGENGRRWGSKKK